MTLIPKNDRVPVQKLGDPLLVGETYPNAGSQYKVLKVEGYYGDAWVQNIKSGWTCKAHRPALYLMQFDLSIRHQVQRGISINLLRNVAK